MSAFTPEELAYLEAHRHESRVHEIYWVYSVPIVTGVLSTALRLWAKRAGRNGITLDDYLIVFATVSLLHSTLSTMMLINSDLRGRPVCQWPGIWYVFPVPWHFS